MNVELDGSINVTLSERNLKDLVMQSERRSNGWLDPEGPALAQLVRNCEQPDGTLLFLRIVVEQDEAHYGDRKPGPGVHGNEA